MMGYGVALLGFGHPRVSAAIEAQLGSGPTPSLTSPIEIEVAEKVVSMVPCARQVAFGKNGSDVLGLAVRVARAYTGRDVVCCCGYHGMHDWYMASIPGCRGIPQSQRELIRSFEYNDLGSLRRLLEEFNGLVAAVILEPATSQLPEPGFLEGVRDLATRFGAVLIFDEVMTGFRLARGGAQELFGVIPDLACLSKALANGMPLSALVGPDRLGEAVSAAMYGLTFRAEILSLAAANATLQIHQEEPVAEHVRTVGERLRGAVGESARAVGVELSLNGPAARMSFRIAAQGGLNERELLALFTQECLLRGVLHNTHLLPSYAHDDEQVDETCKAFHDALQVVAGAIDRRTLDGFLHMPLMALWLDDDQALPPANGGVGSC